MKQIFSGTVEISDLGKDGLIIKVKPDFSEARPQEIAWAINRQKGFAEEANGKFLDLTISY